MVVAIRGVRFASTPVGRFAQIPVIHRWAANWSIDPSVMAPPPVNWEQIAAYSIDARSRDVAGASFACPQAALLALLRASIATFGQPTGQVLFARRIDSGRDE
jgi:hypothetical protein